MGSETNIFIAHHERQILIETVRRSEQQRQRHSYDELSIPKDPNEGLPLIRAYMGSDIVQIWSKSDEESEGEEVKGEVRSKKKGVVKCDGAARKSYMCPAELKMHLVVEIDLF